MANVNTKISWVYLTSKIRQLIVAVLSVTFGISMYIFMNSFMNGVNGAQTEITFTTMAHIRVYNELGGEPTILIPQNGGSDTLLSVSNARHISYTEGIRNADEVVQVLQKHREVVAVTEQVSQNVFFRNGVTKVSGTLSGIAVTNEIRMFNTMQYMTEGDLNELERRSDAVVLGTGLADKLSASVGDNVTLTTSDGVSKILKVTGLIQTGTGSVDKSRALISINTARQLLSKNKSYATEVLANIGDYNKAKAIAGAISPDIKYKTEAWQEGNGQLESANTLRDIIAIAVSLTILIVAGFGIYNIMNMTVSEKIREIAILKAMGFDGKDIVQIFLVQSVIIGLIGGFIGLLLGFTIASIVDRIPFKIASLDTLPISYLPADYILAMVFGLIITFVAGYLPARKASKIDPVEILRG
ncbi:lipoprotein-releasing system permease protein [Dyadobacter sp. BE34]|uniref:Lipoprotein-releasing system permease protein n=1 Tax=Dyadobacter fermentans TaxID=94254 RepID=A0ABU1R8U9_9BACT|nr:MULTISPECIES: FtsX-like permease family protein [Dyadobacter]MDR6809627.1 lipoprotein-releasing system permease protein [Dyadobacter fermentans]MDR7047305.1 lipoprotein-releasing system permease protein [Dyadobacter sp. BE242]MDR7201541.1 lipoprotein-releasing system permease protein [Dyadobacter sp. BE34]MDR7219411.1 lipoprotein-releasing system permease protein [Dyadobacter sp. BE31]MDR7267195.1 lipoprotein-releasing system permease protein [Dyadobacter sp. BE32]